ncbi:hypothetical protein KHQ82_03020 [Mycoplasmatota bacterium]|nr:hypothetical protein KHQ82_03020 [Mycoplasmatota bacterium]
MKKIIIIGFSIIGIIVVLTSKIPENTLENYFDIIYDMKSYDVSKIQSGTELDLIISQTSVKNKCKEYFSSDLTQNVNAVKSHIQLLTNAISNGYTFSLDNLDYTYYTNSSKRNIRNLNYNIKVVFIDEEMNEQLLEVKGYLQLVLRDSKWVINTDQVVVFPKEELGMIETIEDIEREVINQDLIDDKSIQEEMLKDYFDVIYDIENYDVVSIKNGSKMEAFLVQDSVIKKCSQYFTEELSRYL